MSIFLMGQVVGAAAVVISLVVYQVNNRSKMLRLSMADAALYALSFFLLHAPTGAAMNLIAAGRCYAFNKVKPNKRTAWLFWLFTAISVAAAIATWGGPISLLPLAGTLLYGLSEWQPTPKLIRRVGLLAPPLWFIYNFVVQSYPGMFIEVFVVISNGIGQYRFDFRLVNTHPAPKSRHKKNSAASWHSP